MTHLNDGQLRAALDGELDAQAREHLAACLDCQTRQSRLQTAVRGRGAKAGLPGAGPAGTGAVCAVCSQEIAGS